nr:protein FAR1-RELATED SEQUENCE 5-like [Ipomoea batatas]
MATFHDKDHNIVEIEEDHGFEIPTQLSERNHDELVNNGEFNIGEMEQDASENVKSDVNNETTELCIGMEFQSLDDALMCYTNYAKHEGFGIRKSRILKSRKLRIKWLLDKSLFVQRKVTVPKNIYSGTIGKNLHLMKHAWDAKL